MGEMDHEIDFGDVEIVKSPKTVQSVLDKRAMRDILYEPTTLTP